MFYKQEIVEFVGVAKAAFLFIVDKIRGTDWREHRDSDGLRRYNIYTGETQWWNHTEKPDSVEYWSKFPPDKLDIIGQLGKIDYE